MVDPGKQYKPTLIKRPVRFLRKLLELGRKGRLIPDVVQYPGDRFRIVVRNQLIVQLETPLQGNEIDLRIGGIDVRVKKDRLVRQVKVKRVSHCNPALVLLEGEEIHFLTGDIDVDYRSDVRSSGDTITPPPKPPKVTKSSANDIRYSPDTITPPPKVKSSSGGTSKTPVSVAITPASFDFQLRRISAASDGWSAFPIVAVMDTGIDFAYPNTENIPILYNGGRRLCDTVETDYIGWDFVHDQNDPYDDDDNNKHGSRIAAIISREMNHQVRILPLKVIDSLGIGSLFDIFCGFEYILKLPEKPRIVNASWGFYSKTENDLLTYYIDQLHRAKIWLANAAGNRGDIVAGQIKDLNDAIRFPACYSKDHFNVVTITTVSEQSSGTAMPTFEVVENYSKIYVNAGMGSGEDSMFREPLVEEDSPPVKGSSYATPYATAYAALTNLPPDDEAARTALLLAMPGNTQVPALNTKIENGFVVPVE